MTDALADEPAALPLFQPTLDLADARKAPLHVFVLDLSLEENTRRLTDPKRGGAKLLDVEVLTALRASNALFVPDGAILIDVTALSAVDAAEEIVKGLEE